MTIDNSNIEIVAYFILLLGEIITEIKNLSLVEFCLYL